MDADKTIKKYFKPHLLKNEAVFKQALTVAALAFIYFVIVYIAEEGISNADELIMGFGISGLYAFFFAFIPFFVIKGCVDGYRIWRKQIMGKDNADHNKEE